jgi:hypothetical protein
MYNKTIATILACALSFWIGYETAAYNAKVEFAQFLNKLNDSKFK